MLPRYSTRFVGRGAELDALTSQLGRGGGLWTLAGPAGVGKTRLAAAVAMHWAQRGRPAAFCELAEATDVWGLVRHVAPAIGLSLGETRDVDSAVERVGRALGHRHGMLVVFDNFEQLLGQRDVIAGWLDAGADLRFVVTSRRPLRIEREQVHRVTSLGADDAVALFVDRARRRAGELDLDERNRRAVHALVERLDRLPLAIELAAARSTALSPAQIRDRLGDRFGLVRGRGSGRHAALAHAIGWSWELLDDTERAVLAQCSVFAGAFDVAAAEGVIETEQAVLDVVEALVDHSLLHTGASTDERRRFASYESVREYARQALERMDGLEAARARHAMYFRGVVDRLAARVEAGDRRGALDALEASQDDLLAALWWYLACDPEQAAHIATALDPLWTVRGPFFTQLHVLDEVHRRLPAEPTDRVERTRFDLAHGSALRRAGRLVEAGRALERGLQRIPRGHPGLRAELLAAMAWLEAIRGDQERGAELGRQALADARRSGFERVEAAAAEVAGGLGGDLELLRRAADLARRRGDELQEAYTQWLHGRVLVEWGRPIEALGSGERALALARSLGERRLEPLAMGALAQACHFAGELERALEWYREAIALHAADGHVMMQGARLGEMARVEYELGRFADARTHASDAIRLARDAGHMPGAAAAQALLSIVSATAGQPDEARQLLREAHAQAGDAPPSACRAILEVADVLVEGDPGRGPRADDGASDSRDGGQRTPIGLRQAHRLWEAGLQALSRNEAHTQAAAPTLVVGPRARWFRLGGREASLERRRALRAVLMALVEAREQRPGAGVEDDVLIARAWPGERIAERAARNRLRNAIATLRGAGLRQVLLTRSDGYLLDPDRPLARGFNGD